MARLNLHLGARVTLIKDMIDAAPGLVSGTSGAVLSFVDPNGFSASGDGGKRYPIVAFEMPSGSKRRVLILPEVFSVEKPDGEVEACRMQVCERVEFSGLELS